MTRILPNIPRIKAHWDRRGEELPYLMVPMSDGSTIRYNPEIRQPAPVLKDKLDKFTDLCIGYKKTGDEATSTGRRK